MPAVETWCRENDEEPSVFVWDWGDASGGRQRINTRPHA